MDLLQIVKKYHVFHPWPGPVVIQSASTRSCGQIGRDQRVVLASPPIPHALLHSRASPHQLQLHEWEPPHSRALQHPHASLHQHEWDHGQDRHGSTQP